MTKYSELREAMDRAISTNEVVVIKGTLPIDLDYADGGEYFFPPCRVDWNYAIGRVVITPDSLYHREEISTADKH